MSGSVVTGTGDGQKIVTRWAREDVARLSDRRWSTPAIISADDIERISADLDIWDAWPIQDDDGTPAAIGAGATLWMALGSPRFDDPDDRHAHARIYLLRHDDAGWHNLGPAMPDGFSPGSREWSGSAVLHADRQTLRLYFTATGRRSEAALTFEQRLFAATATLDCAGEAHRLIDWRNLDEIVRRNPAHYMASDAGTGAVGTIKAFRDPAYFRDPVDGQRYLFFAGSAADARSPFNGVIGAAVSAAEGPEDWGILPPVIDASGVNNELERPHVIVHSGHYYLFWSTQSHVFAPECDQAPTGLYGMVSTSMDGEWRPINGTGLVFANPDEAPRQAYSWLVLPDLSVISFADDWGRGSESDGLRRFGATFAPVLRLRLSGEEGSLEN